MIKSLHLKIKSTNMTTRDLKLPHHHFFLQLCSITYTSGKDVYILFLFPLLSVFFLPPLSHFSFEGHQWRSVEKSIWHCSAFIGPCSLSQKATPSSLNGPTCSMETIRKCFGAPKRKHEKCQNAPMEGLERPLGVLRIVNVLFTIQPSCLNGYWGWIFKCNKEQQ